MDQVCSLSVLRPLALLPGLTDHGVSVWGWSVDYRVMEQLKLGAGKIFAGCLFCFRLEVGVILHGDSHPSTLGSSTQIPMISFPCGGDTQDLEEMNLL